MNIPSFRQKIRIILAITAKDTLDALKNRTILSLSFGVLVLMLSAKALPLLLALRGLPTLAVHDPAGSAALQTLDDRPDMQLIRLDSEQEMKSLLVDSAGLIIGLGVPAEADLDAGSGDVHLAGYYPNWASPSQVQEQVAFFESVLSEASGNVVRIVVDGHVVYPTDEPALHLMMITQSATLMILLMGMMLVPYLFLEEKEQRTLDALLVSPASYSQLVIGKALAGVVYCLVAAIVVILFNFRYIIHWEIFLLAVVLGSAVAVMLGLLVGILVENQASLGMWMGIALVVLLVPSMAMAFGSARLPDGLASFLSWTPGAAFNNLFRASMYGSVSAALLAKDASILAVTTLLIFALVVWRIRRMDR